MDYIFSHKSRILNKYGGAEGSKILALIERLRKVKKGQTYFFDELEDEPKGCKSKDVVEPARIRELLNAIDLDSTKVHTFLFIGGNDLIPFDEVPNPAHDDDAVILSDLPYASRGEDILIPQRSIGRIPDAQEDQGDFLIDILERVVRYHEGWEGFEQSFGYSASIWKHASREVFRIIGDPDTVRLSPPLSSDGLKKPWMKKQLLYFNLHGSRETPHWYGQRAPGDPPEFDGFPVAISPKNVPGLKGSCVYSEACYGAWVKQKGVHESMALTLMVQGAVAFVGSTAIAYGPIEPPSGEADLLGKYFFEYVLRGIPFGEALRHAKIDFARTMIREQGFLDSDDKKTLIEFHLYGDPSLNL
jgi:hypothetical protein